ncbi:MAG: ABC transporter substrate-binding protein [Anaerolineae bacterium]|jgi:peptide/nickel transport system substrate-binding protein
MTFGQRLRSHRLARRLTLRALAERVGVSFTYLSKLENDRTTPPSAETVARLAAALGVDPTVMMCWAGRIPDDVAQTLVRCPELVELVRTVARFQFYDWSSAISETIQEAMRSVRQAMPAPAVEAGGRQSQAYPQDTEESVIPTDLTRRAFLRTSALAATAAALAACSGAATPAPVAPVQATPPTTPVTEAETPAVEAQPTTQPASAYSESPMLAERVAAGELPPVEERLPSNPMVLEPLEEIGTYCDTWLSHDKDPSQLWQRYGAEPFVAWAPDAKTIIPNFAYRWDVSEDAREYTFYFREGVKWSDGEPWTAGDVLFWYEDVVLNTELTPAFPEWLTTAGKPGVVEAVDDYTVRFRFEEPHGIFLDLLYFNGNNIMNYPRHYLEQFHIKYADQDELERLVKDSGQENWWKLFASKVDPIRNPDLPTIRPWRITTPNWAGTGVAIAERNPYYWKVDTAGQQLPYFDKLQFSIVDNTDLIPMKVVTGEVGVQFRAMNFADYPLYMENRESGGYDVLIWGTGESGTGMHINQARTGDDEMRELVRKREFRVALSKSFNREDFKQMFYYGLSQDVTELLPQALREDPEIQDYFVYDVDAANAMLDELGLDQRDSDGNRLLPSGRLLQLRILGRFGYPPDEDVAALEAEFLREVGIATYVDFVPSEVWGTRQREGEYDVIQRPVDWGPGGLFWIAYCRSLFPTTGSGTFWAVRWEDWYVSRGASGEEPNELGKTLAAMYDELKITPDAASRDAIVDEARRIVIENLLFIPIFGSNIQPTIAKRGMTNVPEETVIPYPTYGPKQNNPETWFLKQV